MHTPTKKQFQLVIDNFKKVLSLATMEGNLDMGENRVNTFGHACGTVHCVAGWYAVATLHHSIPLDFSDGAHAMAVDLGFENKWRLEDWARDNPKIWGNSYGSYMFYSDSAYNDAKTLQEVIKHLQGVRNRLSK